MLLLVLLLPFLLALLTLCSGLGASDPDSLTVLYQVWEEQVAGTRVGHLADDVRRGAANDTGPLEDFQVVEHGRTLPFSVGTQDGVITTLHRLDREQLCRAEERCELAFSVLYRRAGAVHYLRVLVEVLDLNDHAPAFPGARQEVEISEAAGLRMRLPLDRAEDPDAGPNGLQNYTLLSPSRHFALEVRAAPGGGAVQAELVVAAELDREAKASFELTLLAWDGGTPPRSGSTLVHVSVLDSNDNSPSFEDPAPMLQLSEDTAKGTAVLQLRASDPDQGPNGEVEYSLSRHAPPEIQRLFAVDPQSGELALKAPLDYEARHAYEVDVQARDRGPNSVPSHCKVHVKLMDVNDNAPRIHVTWTPPDSPVATVMEGAPRDTFLALVMVSDADAGDNGRVDALIRPGSGPFRLKRIHGDNYMVVTDGNLDRETVTSYNVTLLARDRGDPPLSCARYLAVQVLDENDNAPVFSRARYSASVRENDAAGVPVLTVEARDADLELSGMVSYSIQESNDLGTATAAFSVHPSSGVVSARRPLDYEDSHSYSFVVMAVDQGRPPLTATATVHIDMQDVNDNRPLITEPKPKWGVALLSVPVDADKGEIVTEMDNRLQEHSTAPSVVPSSRRGLTGFLATTVKAEDPDSGPNGQLTFSVGDSNPSGLFWLDSSSGQLFVNATNATELIGKTCTVDVTVADMGTPSLVATATLEVTFINLKDHLKNSSPGNRGHLSFTTTMAVCLGATCLLLLLAVATVTTFCRPEKRDRHAYNCRTAESTYTRHPRRPQRNIRKSDIQLVPVLRGRKDEPPGGHVETRPLGVEPADRVYNGVPSSPSVQSGLDGDGRVPGRSKTLRKPGSIELDSSLPRSAAAPPCSSSSSSAASRTLRRARDPSSCSSASRGNTLKRHGNPAEEGVGSQQATLRRPRGSEGGASTDAEHARILRNLVRLSMAAFGENLELSSASPDVQQISQLLALLHQGEIQPRPNFRGNKYSHRSGRYGELQDWQSTKDSGHGESEAGDDWEPGDTQLDYTHTTDDVFEDPAWLARLSLPLTTDYHDNLFVPDGPPSADLPGDASSFSTFGKAQDKDRPLGGGALLSEVSSLFEMLMSQKADAQPSHAPGLLYRLSAAYRRSLGLEGANTTAGTTLNAAKHSGDSEKRSDLAQSCQ